MRVHSAEASDQDFIDTTYAAVNCPAATADDDVLVAEADDGERVGLGRLVPVADGTVELGGIWVDERFRRHGLAATIVKALLGRAAGRRVFCVPFTPLMDYNKRFGFVDAPRDESVPAPILAKLSVCRATFPQGVGLLRLP
jgi:GNAT superfamily N-acetyltransferase